MVVRVVNSSNRHNNMCAFYFAFYTEQNSDLIKTLNEKRDTSVCRTFTLKDSTISFY